MAYRDDRSVPPIVLYDANLLYPFHLRNLLIQLGVNYIVSPRWTDTIHDEWIRNLVANGRQTRDRLIRTRDLMQRVLPDADVRGYEPRIASLALPDPDDRHVLAAAIECGAGTILTFNLKHFPLDSLTPFGIVARDLDDFLCELLEADADAIEAVVDSARRNLSKTEPSKAEFIDALERQSLVKFASRLRRATSRP
jgi:hypothetical protein